MSDHEHEHDHNEELDHPESIASVASPIAATILMSDNAIQAAIKFKTENPDWQSMPLRVYLSGKGCDGFEYGVCFDQQDPEDHSFVYGDVNLICDPETFKFVVGSTIEFVDDERGRGFIVGNPRHKQFRGKFYKRKNWEERLKI